MDIMKVRRIPRKAGWVKKFFVAASMPL